MTNKNKELHLIDQFNKINHIDVEDYERFGVKRGLRNPDGTGVVAGVTNISTVHGYVVSDGVKTSDHGVLRYRGYSVEDLLSDDNPESRLGFEEVVYLLLMGELPNTEQIDNLVGVLDSHRELPDGFTRSLIMRNTPPSVMNVLSRSILLLYGYDDIAEDRSVQHEIDVALSLISRIPRIAVLSYLAQRSEYHRETMFIHRYIEGHSTAETILSGLRIDREFTAGEARMLDVMLALHAEHGGGNNSTFTARVLTSSDTDSYSAYAGAVGSLKGLKHGGANLQVTAMHRDIKENVANWSDEGQVADYITKIINKQAYDHTGLVYGMGHAVYTKSDPRAVICKKFARKLAQGTNAQAELELLETIERITPEIFAAQKGSAKEICANVDMYSGFVYSMLGIPEELYTPLFACARMPGWAAHRFEEIVSGKRIVRPAYRAATNELKTYLPIQDR